MTNRTAARILAQAETFSLGTKFSEAIRLAVAALKNHILDHKKHGAKGGAKRSKLYTKKDFRRWGRMNAGIPRKKKAA